MSTSCLKRPTATHSFDPRGAPNSHSTIITLRSSELALRVMDILGTPGPARISPGLEDAFMGAKVHISREIKKIAVMHENPKILASADLRDRDVECHQAFRKTFLGI